MKIDINHRKDRETISSTRNAYMIAYMIIQNKQGWL